MRHSSSSSVFIISAGRVVQIVAGLLAVRLFTSILSTTEVGNLYLVNSLVAFFGFALLNPVGMYIHRKLNRWIDEGTLLDRFALFNVYVMAVVLLSMPVVFLLNRGLEVGGGIALGQLLLYVAIYLYVNTWNQMVVTIFNLLEHRVSFVAYTALTTLGGLALSVILVIRSHTAIWWLAGQVAAQVVVTIVAYVHLRRLLGQRVDLRRTRAELNRDNFRHVMAFVVPLGATTFMIWLQSQSYRMIIENRIGLEFLGKIGLGFSIAANIAAAVESVAQQVYLPSFYREVAGGDSVARREACNRMFQRVLPVFLAQALAVTCLAPFLVRLLAHAKFEGAFLFVMYAAWIELFRMTTGLLTIAAHAEMRTTYMIKAYLAGSVLAVAGVFAGSCTGLYEQAIPASLLTAGFVSMAIMFVEMKKIVRLKVGIRQIIASGLVTLPCAGALFFFPLRESIVGSFLVTAVAGSYVLMVQFRIYRRSTVEG
jgi:O-antigen/teichoic acid export membrane protein